MKKLLLLFALAQITGKLGQIAMSKNDIESVKLLRTALSALKELTLICQKEDCGKKDEHEAVRHISAN